MPGDGATQQQLFEQIGRLQAMIITQADETRQSMLAQHRRVGDLMAEGFKELGDRFEKKMDAHEHEDRTVADRVLSIEIQRAGEAEERTRDRERIGKRITLVPIMISAPGAFYMIWQLFHIGKP